MSSNPKHFPKGDFIKEFRGAEEDCPPLCAPGPHPPLPVGKGQLCVVNCFALCSPDQQKGTDMLSFFKVVVCFHTHDCPSPTPPGVDAEGAKVKHASSSTASRLVQNLLRQCFGLAYAFELRVLVTGLPSIDRASRLSKMQLNTRLKRPTDCGLLTFTLSSTRTSATSSTPSSSAPGRRGSQTSKRSTAGPLPSPHELPVDVEKPQLVRGIRCGSCWGEGKGKYRAKQYISFSPPFLALFSCTTAAHLRAASALCWSSRPRRSLAEAPQAAGVSLSPVMESSMRSWPSRRRRKEGGVVPGARCCCATPMRPARHPPSRKSHFQFARSTEDRGRSHQLQRASVFKAAVQKGIAAETGSEKQPEVTGATATASFRFLWAPGEGGTRQTQGQRRKQMSWDARSMDDIPDTKTPDSKQKAKSQKSTPWPTGYSLHFWRRRLDAIFSRVCIGLNLDPSAALEEHGLVSSSSLAMAWSPGDPTKCLM
ncbi:hypothetical protein BDK51DRAFT_45296 [Blyttiomyces helicus]|uniref:Uncharacterized protein n=1 Tax=Blyttiomyces helicus TaxID=388810 RepID=A0A4P9WDK9_9FUNG|nr:hypothetical protein BDK51DRAFT_45296 [Blyttiomyces helicus]|eukprot:RKO90781.1 hypothetical protein BDK51DRAFT_45296 [Blyttiomyces helicus]